MVEDVRDAAGGCASATRRGGDAAAYLNPVRLPPAQRTGEALADLCAYPLRDGNVARWVEQASVTVAPMVARIADLQAMGDQQHADETGPRVGGRPCWLPVSGARWLTRLARPPSRERG